LNIGRNLQNKVVKPLSSQQMSVKFSHQEVYTNILYRFSVVDIIV